MYIYIFKVPRFEIPQPMSIDMCGCPVLQSRLSEGCPAVERIKQNQVWSKWLLDWLSHPHLFKILPSKPVKQDEGLSENQAGIFKRLQTSMSAEFRPRLAPPIAVHSSFLAAGVVRTS